MAIFNNDEPALDKSALPNDIAIRLGALAKESPALIWIADHESYNLLKKSLATKAKSKQTCFADSDAEIRLLSAVAIGLWTCHRYYENQDRPNPPTKKDWTAALKALAVLDDLDSRGVDFLKAIQMPAGHSLPLDWIEQVSSAVRQLESDPPKSYIDQEHIIERQATKAFAHWLWLLFEQVPPIFVTRFAEMINYRSKRITAEFLPRWLDEYPSKRIF